MLALAEAETAIGTAMCEWEDACVVEVDAIGSDGDTGSGLDMLPDGILERDVE